MRPVRQVRVLTVVDVFTRQALATEAASSSKEKTRSRSSIASLRTAPRYVFNRAGQRGELSAGDDFWQARGASSQPKVFRRWDSQRIALSHSRLSDPDNAKLGTSLNLTNRRMLRNTQLESTRLKVAKLFSTQDGRISAAGTG